MENNTYLITSPISDEGDTIKVICKVDASSSHAALDLYLRDEGIDAIYIICVPKDTQKGDWAVAIKQDAAIVSFYAIDEQSVGYRQ